jgi:hypothetical protein
LSNIVIPDNIVNIDSYAFNGCAGLTDIIIPNNVVNIGNNAF